MNWDSVHRDNTTVLSESREQEEDRKTENIEENELERVKARNKNLEEKLNEVLGYVERYRGNLIYL